MCAARGRGTGRGDGRGTSSAGSLAGSGASGRGHFAAYFQYTSSKGAPKGCGSRRNRHVVISAMETYLFGVVDE